MDEWKQAINHIKTACKGQTVTFRENQLGSPICPYCGIATMFENERGGIDQVWCPNCRKYYVAIDSTLNQADKEHFIKHLWEQLSPRDRHGLPTREEKLKGRDVDPSAN